MSKENEIVQLLDYRQAQASNNFVPQPAILSSKSRWQDIHFELHQQPKFETIEHQHTMHVIAYGWSNSTGERWLDGKRQKERRYIEDIAIIPANIAHRCNWNDLAKFGILAIEPTLLNQVGQDLVDSDHISLIPKFMNKRDELITGIFTTLKDELESEKIGSGLLIDSLQTTLAIHLLRKYCNIRPKLNNYNFGLSRAKFKQIAEYIDEHLDTNLKVINLAKIAQISPCHFIRIFKNTTGKTPHQYILQKRLEKARFLLHQENTSISKIAVTVGFCDQSHFTRCFKRTYGITPRQYMIQSQ